MRKPVSCHKPLIRLTTRHGYRYVCDGGGSAGYADTPEKAYRRWLRNYRRRVDQWNEFRDRRDPARVIKIY